MAKMVFMGLGEFEEARAVMPNQSFANHFHPALPDTRIAAGIDKHLALIVHLNQKHVFKLLPFVCRCFLHIQYLLSNVEKTIAYLNNNVNILLSVSLTNVYWDGMNVYKLCLQFLSG